ncbi:MAG: DUF58 domain-containing protein, partial [Thermodesulfovibrionales bacterium]|nr:DUF58 domain-containing protein [Thermodesulfovibrionales bacterium]
MIVSGYLSKLNLSKIALEIEIPDEIYANTESIIKVKLINKKRFTPALLLRVKFLEREILFPLVDGNASEVKLVTSLFSRRGRCKIEKLFITSVFPFNFFLKGFELEKKIEFIVFPKMQKCYHQPYFEKDRRFSSEHGSMTQGFDSDPLFIRDYIVGDPLRYIHWKATAKTGELKTKELSSQLYSPLLIDFESFPIKEIEQKISCITYIINH